MTPRRVGGWEVQGELGRGGQGVVLRARHAVHGTPAALKLLLKQEVKTLLRFRQEAAVLLRLSHPNLVRVYEVGEHDGAPFLAMELVVGQSLDDLVREGGPPPFPRTVKLLAAVARAVHLCHAQGVVHRDLKPENVIVERETGRAVLVDFGMVKRDRELFGALSIDELANLTKTGELRGTPLFMAPEQVSPGGEFGDVGPWTDVHALGAMLHVLLTGEPPWSAATLATVVGAILFEPAPDPRATNPAVPPALARLCLRARSKQRADRPPSAAAFAVALEAALREGPSRRRLVVGLGLGLAVAGGAAVAGALAVRRSAARGDLVASSAAPSASASASAPTPASGGAEPLLARAVDRLAADPAAALDLADEALLAAPDLLRARGVRALARLLLERRLGGTGAAESAALREVIAADEALAWAAGPDGAPDARLADAWLERGLARVERGELDPALADAALVLALRPDEPRAHALRGQVHCLRREGKAALAALERALAAAPGLLAARRLRAEARVLVGDARGALEDAAAALADDPRDPVALFAEARARSALGEHPAAIGALSRLLEVRPGAPAALLERAKARAALGDGAGGSLDLDALIAGATAPADRSVLAAALSLRAESLRTAGEAARAVADAERAVELEPDARRWHELGLARRAVKDDARALQAFDRAVEGYGETAGALAPLQLRAACKRDAGDLQGALADLERATALAPAVWNGWYDLGYTRQKANDLPGAVAAYGRAVEVAKGADQVTALTARALCHRAAGAFAEARADYDRVLERTPERWTVWHDRAAVRQLSGDAAGALADHDRAVELAKGDDLLTALLDRATLRQRQGDHAGAALDLDQVIARAPDRAAALRLRCTSRRALRDHAGAEADAERALALEPGDGATVSARGWLLMRRGELEAARRDFTRALELGHDRPGNLRLRAGVRRDLGDVDGALADLAAALELGPRVDLLLVRSYTLRDWRRDLAGARRDEDAALAMDPASAWGWRSRSVTRLLAGDAAGARADADEAVRLAPEAADSIASRARVLAALGEPGARAEAERAVALDPASSLAHWAHALALEAGGDLAGAVAACGSSIAAEPRAARALATRARALAALGRPAEALDDLARAAALEPGRPDPLLQRAALRERTGDRAGAAEDLTVALRALRDDDPRRAAAAAALERLAPGTAGGAARPAGHEPERAPPR